MSGFEMAYTLQSVFCLLITRQSVAAAAVTALLLILTILWKTISAKKRDPHVRPADQQRASHQKTLQGDDEVPAVFLSHSGKQKFFVEILYKALEKANRSTFLDKYTLPKGSRFPARIIRAAHGCKLGVVVLSNDFFISKWPMIELEILVRPQRGIDSTVLPLFYKLHPGDLKSPKKLSEWRREWKKHGQDSADKWEQAVKALDSFSGEIFTQGTSEVAFIKRVVSNICNLVPNRITCSISGVVGHQRLSQEVARQFEHVGARQCEKVCIVGLHGLGGLGKTTICKLMVDFYDSKYCGRSHLLEFPTNGNDKEIMQECKEALKKLTDLSSKHLLDEINHVDQVVQLMNENLRGYDVFLAIDNVWEKSGAFAKKILEVSFSANSKVLVTSRSEQVLKDMLLGHVNFSVGPLPTPEYEEALQIFQEAFRLCDLNSLLERNQLDAVLGKCKFGGTYHVLALKAFGQYVKRACACAMKEAANIEHHLPLIVLEAISHADLQNVEAVIRLNYENLPEQKKKMFLEIAVLLMEEVQTVGIVHKEDLIRRKDLTYEEALQWLGFLYKEFHKSKIDNLVYELALDGLIQCEKSGRAKMMVKMHDLYFDLARIEAAKSSRFFTARSTASVEEIEWEKLGRVTLTSDVKNPHFIEKLQQEECPKLQVLAAYGGEFRNGIDLRLMPSLRVLRLQRGRLRSIKHWSAATGLTIIILCNLECVQPLEPFPSMPSLEGLTIKNDKSDVVTVGGLPNPDGCRLLKQLQLSDRGVREKGEQYLAAGYFNSFRNLESLHIEHLNRTIRVLILNALVQLKMLTVKQCKFLEGIEGLDALRNLESLSIAWCPCLENMDGSSGLLQLKALKVDSCESLKKMPDLRGLPCLETLDLEAVGGRSPTVKDVDMTGCWVLEKIPDLSGLVFFETLKLSRMPSIKEIGGLSTALKSVDVSYCAALKRVDLSGLTGLESLRLTGNDSMEEVGGECLSSTLQRFSVCDDRSSGSLRSFPSLEGCVHLRTLTLSPHVMKIVADRLPLGARISAVRLTGGGEFPASPDHWKRLTHIEDLNVLNCNFVEMDVGHLGPMLTHLRSLEVEACHEMEEISGLNALPIGLNCLEIVSCASLKKVNGLMAIVTHLQRLLLWGCYSLEESCIPDTSVLHTIEDVHICYCGALSL